MDEPRLGDGRYAVSVSVHATLSGRFAGVNDLEAAILAATHQAGRQLYSQAFTALQDQWLARRRDRFCAQRWRCLHWLTPFGPLALPVRVVREKLSGKYFTLSQILLGPKATRLLSPALEQEACALATAQNYRPAARSLSRWIGARLGPWLVWACVQCHGARRLLELEKASPPPARPVNVPALISEVDSTWLKTQQRHRTGPVKRFPVHLGLHYTGRIRRYQARGSTSLRLGDKHLLVSTRPLALFGRQFQLQAQRHFRPACHVLLSDGDEGLERLRENYFPQAPWLLDRWHLFQAVRAFTGPEANEFHRLMAPLWRADSEAALAALSQSPLRVRRSAEFRVLFGYLLGNREGIDAWRQIPAGLRRGHGRRAPTVKSGSGAVEKNIEVVINRRFKRQGRSWQPERAERLLQLSRLAADPQAWQRWWREPPPFQPKPNPP
jgi:hypothetical protein